MTLTFDGWPRKIIETLFHVPKNYVCYLIAICEFRFELPSGNDQIGAKSSIFRPVWPWNFDGWSWKTIGHLFHAPSSSVHHFIAICEFRLKLQSRNAQFGSKSFIFQTLWPRLWTSGPDLWDGHHICQWVLLLKISWWCDESNIVKRVWQTDRQKEGQKYS